MYGLSPSSCPLISLVHRTGMVKSIYSLSDKAQYSILTDAVVVIRSDVTHGPRYSNCWLLASTWVEAINKMDLVDASLGVDVRSSQPAMSRSPCLEKPTTNLTEQTNKTSPKLDGAVSFSRYFDHRFSIRLRKFGFDASGKPLLSSTKSFPSSSSASLFNTTGVLLLVFLIFFTVLTIWSAVKVAHIAWV